MSSFNDSDDGWAELAREFGLEPKPQPLPEMAEQNEESHHEGFDSSESDEFAAMPAGEGYEAPFDDAESDDGYASADGEQLEADDELNAENDGEANASDDDEEGPKKKRRRRRRRRKSGTGAEGQADEGDDEESPSDVTEPAEDDQDMEATSLSATRELIANWDVPSWETIVTTMLYRPTR